MIIWCIFKLISNSTDVFEAEAGYNASIQILRALNHLSILLLRAPPSLLPPPWNTVLPQLETYCGSYWLVM